MLKEDLHNIKINIHIFEKDYTALWKQIECTHSKTIFNVKISWFLPQNLYISVAVWLFGPFDEAENTWLMSPYKRLLNQKYYKKHNEIVAFFQIIFY